MSTLGQRVLATRPSRLSPRRLPSVRTHVPAATWSARLATLAAALTAQPGATPTGDPASTVARHLSNRDPAVVWLALAVLGARLPTPDEVTDGRRELELNGPEALFRRLRRTATAETTSRHVEVVVDTTVVDFGDLVLYPLGTGIQRVARMVGRSWRERHGHRAVGWTADLDAMVPLDDEQRDRALGLLPFRRPDAADRSGSTPRAKENGQSGPPSGVTVLVPWRSTYVLPELAIQPSRCLALGALARFSGNRTAVIGFDCVPLTSPETTAEGFPAVFALNLAAVSAMDQVVAISEAAADEYRGWRRMLTGAGLAGPDISTVSLPVQAPDPTARAMDEARRLLLIADLPMVLCVGSHEPRKNHLALLHAAELLWREGLQFTLTFVGGSSWGGVEFGERVEELAAQGRPVEALSKLDDETLWAAYRLARVSVFPSLNEGFGLPVGESIAAGTPAITSDFGSMREIAEGGGALMVDPRDDHAIADALRTLLVDERTHARLAAQCRGRSGTTWDEYADELWRRTHDTDSSHEPTPR